MSVLCGSSEMTRMLNVEMECCPKGARGIRAPGEANRLPSREETRKRRHGEIAGRQLWLGVDECRQMRAEAILQIAFLLQPTLEQSLKSVMRLGPRQRSRKRVPGVKEPVD
jgi:hypothetical protein